MQYALIADLEDSRLVEDRRGLADRLQAALAKLADLYADDWLAPIASSKGIDELSSALTRPDRAFEIAVAMNERVWPERFRWALGAGTIDIGLETGDATALDGTAFHAAADALRRAKDSRLLFTVSLDGVAAGSLGLIEAAAQAHAEFMADWSPRQHEFVRAARAEPVQLGISQAFGVTPQTVSQSLKRARFDTMVRIEHAIGQRLAEIGTELGAQA
jgi:SatD family protein